MSALGFLSTRQRPDRVLVVSNGLAQYGQREIALSVKLRPNESPDGVRADLEQLLRVIESLAQQGKLVEAGDLTEFGSPGFLDSSIQGLVYADAPSDEEDIPGEALIGVFLFSEEVQIAKASCAARVLARLGKAASHYPFPVHNDRDRPSMAQEGDAASLLAQVGRVPMYGISLLFENDVLHVRCRASARARLSAVLEEIPDSAAFALLTSPDPQANGRLVWEPGQNAPSAITPPNSAGQKLTGSMLLIAPGVDQDSVGLREDGFTVLATSDTWSAFRAALLEGRAWEFPASGDSLALQVEPMPEPDGRVVH